MFRASATLITTTLLVGAVVTPSDAADPEWVVATEYGDVAGVGIDGVVEWRAIPYAAPPVGELRWREPSEPEPWTDVRLEEDFADPCPQLGFDAPVDGSEDCLYLNVFAPEGTPSTADLPVMVHLHGGRNFFGRAYRDASTFVDRGVIVVTVAYRLGVLGFVGHPLLSAEGGGSSGEYGLLDQLEALEWVRDNIAAFGGNPDNVTLFGESAGSFDAVAIAASPLGEDLFTRLAAQTEAIDAASGRYTIDDAEAMGAEVAEAVACADSDEVLQCLRATPAADLVLAAGINDVVPWTGGRVLPRPPLEAIAADPTPFAMLVGSNREEASFWFAEPLLSGVYRPAWRARDFTGLVGAPNAGAASQLYPSSEYDAPIWSTIALASDVGYTCPVRRLALAGGADVYRYLYTHVYENDPFIAAFRAGHYWDDPILWADPDLAGGYEFSPAEEALSSRMAEYWTNFARTGDPNGPGVPEWPTHTAADQWVAVLDEPGGVIRGYHEAHCDFLDEKVPTSFAPTPVYTPAHEFGWGARFPAWWR